MTVGSAVAKAAAVAVPVLASEGASAPLRGVDAADLVFVEYAEPRVLRFVAVFQSRDARAVGPVGWVRPSDVKALAVFAPLVAHAEAPRGFVEQLARLDVAGVSTSAEPDLFRAVPELTRPYVATDAVRDRATRLAAPPAAFVMDGLAPLGRAGVEPAKRVSVEVAGHPDLSWSYDANRKRWSSAVSGLRLSAANVMVLSMPYGSVTVKHPRRELPSAEVLGKGDARVLSLGRTLEGTWYKPSPRELLAVVDGEGFPVKLAPGPTWVLMVPPTGAVKVG